MALAHVARSARQLCHGMPCLAPHRAFTRSTLVALWDVRSVSEFHAKLPLPAAHVPALSRALSTRSRGKGSSGPSVVKNDAITAPSLRVVAADGTQLGVMDLAAAKRVAAEAKQDLILVAPGAKPPVAKLDSAARQAQAAKKKEAAARKQARANKMKEVRLTARTEAHDLSTKARQLLKFLQQGRPVRVTVAFQPGSSYGAQEEPRRAAMRSIVQEVGTVGWADPASLKVQGVFLALDFKPVVKSAEEHEAVLALLARPLKNQAQVSAVPSTPKKKAPPAAPTVVTDDGKVDESMAQYMAKKARGRTRPEEPTPRATRRGAKGALSDDDLDRVGTPFKEKK